jgi:microcystin-dependent protein
LGQKGGHETVTLTINQLPSHNHAVSVAVNTGNGEESASTNYIASHASAFNENFTPGAVLKGVNQMAVGGNQPVNIQNPFLGINYCIALEGIYPSRS